MILVVVAACDREADQRVHCTEFTERSLVVYGDPKSFIDRCVAGRWSKKQMECHAQNGGMRGMFCDD